MPPYIAWHGLNQNDHKNKMDSYAKQGYRFISLSIYGDPDDPVYAAVMTQETPLVAQREYHFLDAAGMQSTFEDQAKQGYGPAMISATGPANHSRFAAVFSPMSPIPLTRTTLTAGDSSDTGTFQGMNTAQKKSGNILTWMGTYGDPSDRRYIGIWHPNPNGVIWNADGVAESAADYQSRFQTETDGWNRPAFVAVSPDQQYLSMFVDNQIGPWVARHNMSPSDYQTEFDTQTKAGLYPVMVQAGGSSAANARFAAVFAKQRTAVDRQWSATGGPAIPAIDAAMQSVMQSDHVRGAALALVWDKRLVLARGYTWAEPGYPVVQPTTLFRVASCSKTITAIAIHQLLFEKSLHLTDTMQSILKVKTPSGGVPADPRWSQITVRQLLEQNSGLITDYNWEDPQVAAAFNIQLPVSADQTVSYMATKMLKHDPGTTAEYSNFGYFLLGRIVAAKRGKSTLGDGLKSPLMAPLHITRLRSARSLISSQANDESRYFPPDLNLSGSVMSPTRPLVLNEYGNEQLEKGEGGGGLSVAVTDFARILAALNVTANNPMLDPSEIQAMLQAASQSNRGHGWDSMTSLGGGAYMGQKGGLLGSSQNSIYYVSGKLSFVVCWNHNPVSSGSWYPNFPAVVTAANAHDWGSSDLFPQYGMPSFA